MRFLGKSKCLEKWCNCFGTGRTIPKALWASKDLVEFSQFFAKLPFYLSYDTGKSEAISTLRTMHATMLPFPYPLACQSYIDVSAAESVTSSSPSGTPSPPAKHYRCYENMLSGRLRTHEDITSLFTGLSYESMKESPTPVSRKKSFTIEAILGLNEDANAATLGPSRLCDSRKAMSPKSYGVPSASPRTALTAVFSTQDAKGVYVSLS